MGIAKEEHGGILEDDFNSITISDDLSATAVFRSQIDDLIDSLPRNLHWDKHQQQQEQHVKQQEGEGTKLTQTTTTFQILEEDEDDGDSEMKESSKAEEGLDIAWQYRTSVQRERLDVLEKKVSQSSNIFCHSYDLSGRLKTQSQLDTDHFIFAIHQNCTNTHKHRHGPTCGFHLFRELVSALRSKEGKVVRLLLFHPDLDLLAVALPLLLAHIRQHQLPVVILICTPGLSSNSKTWIQLQRAADVVLLAEGFASRLQYPPPPEFSHLQGLLTLAKVNTSTAATANGGGHYGDLTISKRPTAYLYGLKRDRRKLHIPLLHIPPEDYAAGGGSVGSGGVRSGAGRIDTKPKPNHVTSGMGCSSNIAGSVLDF